MKVVQNLFAMSFAKQQGELPNPDAPIQDIVKHLETIDNHIRAHAPKYPLDRIAKPDLAILRLSVYELAIVKEEPPKVIIDEAVTLAKEFGSDRSYAFVNAVLGAVYKAIEAKDDNEQHAE